jgi:hypothetical protein
LPTLLNHADVQAKLQAASDSTAAALSSVREQLEEAVESWQDQLLLVQQQVDRDTEVEARAIVQELIDHQVRLKRGVNTVHCVMLLQVLAGPMVCGWSQTWGQMPTDASRAHQGK